MSPVIQPITPTRLAFVCSSLAAGRDGVGDYTRRLAAECVRQGSPSVVVALNDLDVPKPLLEWQETDGTAISVLRLPGSMTWSGRIEAAREWLSDFGPDWISLQLVPFGFHPKGLCFEMGKRLASLKPRIGWHLMIHELWLGLGENSPVKHRLWGALQRRIVLDLVRRLQPRIIHTQAEPYQIVLSREKIAASILPLFSNIPRADVDGWDSQLKPLITEATGRQQNRNELYLAGVLGRVHPEWSAELAVNTLLPLVERSKKRLVLVFHGNNNLTPAAVRVLKEKLQGRAVVLVTGERSPLEISGILQALDLGLATSPRQNIQKSGSIAAMIEHGLPILVTRDDWRLRGWDSVPAVSFKLFTPGEFSSLKTLPTRDSRPPRDSGVKQVALRMLAALNPGLPSNGSNRFVKKDLIFTANGH